MTADATITRIQPTKVTINRQRQARVVYEFRDDRGRMRTGRSSHMPIDDAMAWKPGERITIRYDRDRPEISAWEPQ